MAVAVPFNLSISQQAALQGFLDDKDYLGGIPVSAGYCQ